MFGFLKVRPICRNLILVLAAENPRWPVAIFDTNKFYHGFNEPHVQLA